MRTFEEWTAVLDINEAVTKESITKHQLVMEKKITSAARWMDKQRDGIFVWHIDKINERRANSETISSEYFYAKMQPYKLALRMAANGYRDTSAIGLNIWFHVHADSRNELLQWPFAADVTITITNKATPYACQIVRKHCVIQNPIINPWERSEDFSFLYSDLCDALILIDNCLVVECHVDPSEAFYSEE